MRACQIEAHIPPNRRLEIVVPENFPVGEAEVIVLSRKGTTKEMIEPTNALDALLTWQQSLPRQSRSLEDIATQVREEREAWGS